MAGESQAVPDSAPDPSVYTMEAIDRAVTAERDYVDLKIAILVQRLNSMDEATKVLHDTVTQIPTDVQLAVGHLKELHGERFASVAIQFADQKASAAKTETAIKETVTKQGDLFASGLKAQADKHDDLKDRVNRIESMKQGGQESKAALYAAAAFVATVISIIAYVISNP